MASPKRIVVIGSVNMDLVCRTARIPNPGETVLGDQLVTIPGGKGANQAVAAAKLAGPEMSVDLIARVGDDDFGQRLFNGLTQHGVGVSRVTITEGVSSGCAMILIDGKGENSIVVAPGANGKLVPADIDAAEDLIRGASAVLMQQEVPLATIAHAIALCQRLGVFTILDPAPSPAKGLPRALYGVDILTPNQSEAERLLGFDPDLQSGTRKSIDPKQIATRLLARGCGAAVIKQGARGAMLVGRDGVIRTVRGFKVKIIDTTAAGDAFTAALAVAHTEGLSLPDAVRFANAAGALACQSFGAQPALPAREAARTLAKM